MKKVLALLLVLTCSAFVFAQDKKEVTIKAGTIVPLESVNSVRASEVNLNQSVDFRVTSDVKVGDEVVIPRGTIAKGTVIEAKRNTWWGTKGRLGIKLRNVVLPNGDVLYFSSSDVYISGKNRTALSVVLAIFVLPCCAIHGGRAEMPAGYEVDAEIAGTTTITL